MISTDVHWLRFLGSEYGVSFRQANRRYEVGRHLRHRRMELFWISLNRVRKYILLEKGYDPVLNNFDQTPYYQNEAGALNKLMLAVQWALVPVVEGKGAAHSRWTACLSCCSSKARITERWPFAEAMYKAADEVPKSKELQEFRRTSGYKE